MAPAPSKGKYRSSLKLSSNTPPSFCDELVVIDVFIANGVSSITVVKGVSIVRSLLRIRLFIKVSFALNELM